MTRSRLFNQRILALFASALLIVAATAGCIYVSFDGIKTDQQWVTHTYDVMKQINEINLNLKDTRSAKRSFLITGDETYLNIFYENEPKINDGINVLGKLISDNPNQVDRVAVLRKVMTTHLQGAHDMIETYKNVATSGNAHNAQVAAFTHIRDGTEQHEMDDLNGLMHNMLREEERLLQARQDVLNNTVNMTLWLGAGGLLICMALIFAVFALMQREVRRRAEIEASLHYAFDQMQQISTENELISRMGDYFQSCNTPEEAFDIIARNMDQLLPQSFGAIAIFNNSRNLIEPVVKWGDNTDILREFVPDQCWALRRGRQHRIHPGGVEPVCGHIHTVPEGGTLCMPMQAHGETIGLFFIAAQDDKPLDERHRALAHTISEQISLAIANLKLQEKLRQQSIRDPLTRMFNRRYLEETLAREMFRAQHSKAPLCLMMIDIDYFKRFNDSFGHDAGDMLIVEFSRLVLNSVRKEDIACRYGGEEFLIAMPNTSIEAAQQWAEQLSEATHRLEVTLNGKKLDPVTVSIGLAAMITNDSSMQLIHDADTALYKAKHNGRNQVMVAQRDDMSLMKKAETKSQALH